MNFESVNIDVEEKVNEVLFDSKGKKATLHGYTGIDNRDYVYFMGFVFYENHRLTTVVYNISVLLTVFPLAANKEFYATYFHIYE